MPAQGRRHENHFFFPLAVSQSFASGQPSHLGLRAVQVSRPKRTIRWQKSLDSLGGMHWRSCRSTWRGSLEPSVMPRRPVMRMQWVSQT